MENFDNIVSLKDWLAFNRSDEKLQNLFYSMSSTVKYLHEDLNASVASFNLGDISILNDDVTKILFMHKPLPSDLDEAKEIVADDIRALSYIAICVYFGSNSLNWSFLKENFDEFSKFLPSTDIPYYKGIVVNNFSVYFCDYVAELQKREANAFNFSDSGGNSNGQALVRSNGHSVLNGEQYGDLYKTSDAAFIGFLVVPALVAIFGIMFTLFAWLMGVK